MILNNDKATNEKIKAAILAGIESFPSLYITASGRRVRASRLADVKKEMISAGWKNISSIDEIDCKSLGLEVVEAYYGQKARVAKRFCKVIVSRDAEGERT